MRRGRLIIKRSETRRGDKDTRVRIDIILSLMPDELSQEEKIKLFILVTGRIFYRGRIRHDI